MQRYLLILSFILSLTVLGQQNLCEGFEPGIFDELNSTWATPHFDLQLRSNPNLKANLHFEVNMRGSINNPELCIEVFKDSKELCVIKNLKFNTPKTTRDVERGGKRDSDYYRVKNEVILSQWTQCGEELDDETLYFQVVISSIVEQGQPIPQTCWTKDQGLPIVNKHESNFSLSVIPFELMNDNTTPMVTSKKTYYNLYDN
ncbi:MAG: hypothetical protein KDD48_00650 [Bdellovibrionales bacterium]|nr:hypothetical protein [Bdellovibrionales bacterium]